MKINSSLFAIIILVVPIGTVDLNTTKSPNDKRLLRVSTASNMSSRFGNFSTRGVPIASTKILEPPNVSRFSFCKSVKGNTERLSPKCFEIISVTKGSYTFELPVLIFEIISTSLSTPKTLIHD